LPANKKEKVLSKIYIRVIAQLVLVLFFYQIIRWLFFYHNHDIFNGLSFFSYLSVMWHSLWFDLSSLFAVNAIYLVLALLPFGFIQKKASQFVLSCLFIIGNLLSFLFDIADIAYFPYTRKRMTADVFELMQTKSDFVDLLPSYLVRFWFISIFIVIIMVLFIFLNYKIEKQTKQRNGFTFHWKYMLLYVVSLGICVVGIRGGLQLKPIIINNALLVEDNKYAPLVYNTPFSILHSFEEIKLYPLHNFSSEKINQYWNPNKDYTSSQKFDAKNVVIIILESFGKMYTGLGGRKSVTPFLDSLSKQSLVFTHAFANAGSSATGIPAVLAGIPNFYNEAFTTSPYGRNKIDAIGNLLKPMGYNTSFYHGGTNGTMNFNVFSSNAGFDQYYGKNEYPNEKDFDGTWGIYDEPYLQYFAQQLNKEKQPFATAIFTLSSHEPFSLPKNHLKSLDTLKNIYKGIAYTDNALKHFFSEAKKMPWYKNTVFVLTADHNYMAGVDEKNYYNNGLGIYAIPVVMFSPADNNLQGIHTSYFQQIDILPTLLDYLHYPSPFFAFGSSAFRNEPHFVYNHSNQQNIFCMNDTLLMSQDSVVYQAYDLKADSFLTQKIPIENNSIYPAFSTYLQLLHQSIIENKMSLRKK
jgi:phosphoglycerol transferase MdoB-like AlkP superfamily enzyme